MNYNNYFGDGNEWVKFINDGNTLCHIPYELRTKELCELAIKQNGNALKFVPDNLRTKKLCETSFYFI
jgi:hypothetical protein